MIIQALTVGFFSLLPLEATIVEPYRHKPPITATKRNNKSKKRR